MVMDRQRPWPWLVVMATAQRFGRQVLYPVMVFSPGVTGAFARRGSTHARSLVCEL